MSKSLKIIGTGVLLFIVYFIWNAPEKLNGGKYLKYYTKTSDNTYWLYLKENIEFQDVANLNYIFNYNPVSEKNKLYDLLGVCRTKWL